MEKRENENSWVVLSSVHEPRLNDKSLFFALALNPPGVVGELDFSSASRSSPPPRPGVELFRSVMPSFNLSRAEFCRFINPASGGGGGGADESGHSALCE